jgi:hypothetical protein
MKGCSGEDMESWTCPGGFPRQPAWTRRSCGSSKIHMADHFGAVPQRLFFSVEVLLHNQACVKPRVPFGTTPSPSAVLSFVV